jgi:type II secretory pathway pseudopilin PulG
MKKSFTLMEIVVVLIICGILATIAIPMYQSVLDSSKAKVCYTNQLTILKAVDIYTLENDRMPISLTMLPAKYIQRAYAQILPKASWKIKLAYWLVDREGLDMAYAQTSQPWIGKFISNTNILSCPLDNSANKYDLYPGSTANYTVFKSLTATPIIHDNSAWHKKNGYNYSQGVNSRGDRMTSPDSGGTYLTNTTW